MEELKYNFKTLKQNHPVNQSIDDLSNYANMAIKFLDKTIVNGKPLTKKIMEFLGLVANRISNILANSPQEHLQNVEVLKQYEEFITDLVAKFEKIAFHKPTTQDETTIKILILTGVKGNNGEKPIPSVKKIFNNLLGKVKTQLSNLNNANPVNFPKPPDPPPKDEEIPKGKEENDCCCCSCCSIL